jgi:pyruvate dehydrogenase E1 component beta subunit
MPLMPNDAKSLLISSIFDNNPVIFLEHRWLYDIKEDVNKNFNKSKLDSFKKISDGKNLTIVSSGFSSLECLKISKFLKKYGITVDNFNFQVFKPLNIKPIISSLKKTGLLLTIDTGHIMYGISSELISSIVSHDIKLLKKNPIRLGLPDIPTPSSRGYVKDYYPNSKNIINSITNLLGLKQSKSIEILKSFEKEFNTVNYDVPNNHFKGPF